MIEMLKNLAIFIPTAAVGAVLGNVVWNAVERRITVRRFAQHSPSWPAK